MIGMGQPEQPDSQATASSCGEGWSLADRELLWRVASFASLDRFARRRLASSLTPGDLPRLANFSERLAEEALNQREPECLSHALTALALASAATEDGRDLLEFLARISFVAEDLGVDPAMILGAGAPLFPKDLRRTVQQFAQRPRELRSPEAFFLKLTGARPHQHFVEVETPSREATTATWSAAEVALLRDIASIRSDIGGYGLPTAIAMEIRAALDDIWPSLPKRHSSRQLAFDRLVRVADQSSDVPGLGARLGRLRDHLAGTMTVDESRDL
jgi:hypothetical protein